MSNHDSDHEIRAEHHEVVKMRDVKREAWRNEQEIPQKRAESGKKEGRPPAQSRSSENDGEQIEKRDSPIAGIVEYRQAESGDAAGDSKSETEITPWGACQSLLNAFSSRRRRFLGRNHVNIDVAAVTHEPPQWVALPKGKPPSSQRLSNYDLRDVMFTRDPQQRFPNIG